MTLVIADNPGAVDDDALLGSKLKVADRLWLAGDTRPPMFMFATKEDSAEIVDPDD